jgi:DNA-binding response OmpR family regulator
MGFGEVGMSGAKRSMRILLVDDNVATRRWLEQLFELNGVGVDAAATAAEARARMSGQDCAVVDWMLGEETSAGVIATLRARGIPVAVFTVTEEPEEIERQTGLDQSLVFMKPDFHAVMRWVERQRKRAAVGVYQTL